MPEGDEVYAPGGRTKPDGTQRFCGEVFIRKKAWNSAVSTEESTECFQCTSSKKKSVGSQLARRLAVEPEAGIFYRDHVVKITIAADGERRNVVSDGKRTARDACEAACRVEQAVEKTAQEECLAATGSLRRELVKETPALDEGCNDEVCTGVLDSPGRCCLGFSVAPPEVSLFSPDCDAKDNCKETKDWLKTFEDWKGKGVVKGAGCKCGLRKWGLGSACGMDSPSEVMEKLEKRKADLSKKLKEYEEKQAAGAEAAGERHLAKAANTVGIGTHANGEPCKSDAGEPCGAAPCLVKHCPGCERCI